MKKRYFVVAANWSQVKNATKIQVVYFEEESKAQEYACKRSQDPSLRGYSIDIFATIGAYVPLPNPSHEYQEIK